MPFSLIPKSSKLILALSGGPDSMYLLHLALIHFPKKNLIIAHFNHQTRPLGSLLDCRFMKKTAKKLNLPIEIGTLSKSKKHLSENTLRKARYDFLEEIRKKHDADYILTAHHQNDQTETLLLRLIRGTTFTGLTGIKELDPTRHLYRPFLTTQKSTILTYLKTHSLPFRTDKSNNNTRYSRNYLRHKIIPLLNRLNPNFSSTFSSSLNILAQTQNYLEQEAKNWLKKNLKTSKKTAQKVPSQSPPHRKGDSTNTTLPKSKPTLNLTNPKLHLSFPLPAFLAAPPILQLYILGSLYRDINNSNLPLPFLNELSLTLQRNKSGLSKEFGPNFRIKITKNPHSNKRQVEIMPKFQ